MLNEVEEEWEMKRMKYASTNVDTEEESIAVKEIIEFADMTGHGKASCFIGHWYYHGEGGLNKSYDQALVWYKRSADTGFEGGIHARDRMYIDGTACGPNSQEGGGASDEVHNLAVERLEELMDSSDRNLANAALSTLTMWGRSRKQVTLNEEGKEQKEEEGKKQDMKEKQENSQSQVGSTPETLSDSLYLNDNEMKNVEVDLIQSEKRQDIVSSIDNPVLKEELDRDKERLSLLRELRELEKRASPSDTTTSNVSLSSQSVSSYGDSRSGSRSTVQPLTPFGQSGRGSPPRRMTPNNQLQIGSSGGGEKSVIKSAADVALAAPPSSEPRGVLEADRERALALQCILASDNYDSYMVMLETMKVNGIKKSSPPPLPDDAVTYRITSRNTGKELLRLQTLCNSYQPASTGYRIPKPLASSSRQRRRSRGGGGSNSEISTPLSSLRANRNGSGHEESFPLGNVSGGALLGTAPRNSSAGNRSQSLKGGINASTPARAQ